MPRPRSITDDQILQATLDVARRVGAEGVTFAAVGEACGLSGSTLVQRFSSKAGLVHAAFLYAWDGLDRETARLAEKAPRTPAGAVQLLVGLSGDYGDIDSYADNLLLLREDLRHADLRARGAAWGATLQRAVALCLGDLSDEPEALASLLLAQWQGTLTWWGFDPTRPIDKHVESQLLAFLAVFGRQKVSPAR
jgi:AcrR family transcriptional regulator